ncbi:MAG: hypothetical protein COA50_05745 [Flavobacteriaceae bacterium]|nr:MAG: hypothetical protein COA50_05745 [Flavobacteriaceae bacterium]
MKPSFILLTLTFLILNSCNKNHISYTKKNGAMIVAIDEKPVLSYQYETMYPPAGVDSAFQRSGYIHPLKTLSGHTLTWIQPEDHYHHYGLWNPWTHVLFEKDTLDFWNLKKKEATVRFADFKEISRNKFSVLQEHVVLKDGEEKIALNEVQTIEFNKLSDEQYTIDFTIDYSCATDSPFKILEYRYAGFSIRATEKWNAENSKVISSEVQTRDEIDGTLGKWVLVQGELGNDYGGFLLLSNTSNFNHPEPLRVWPKGNHEGWIFVNFAPTKTKDWLLEPGKIYTLKYRMVVSNTEISADEAEEFWTTYTNH